MEPITYIDRVTGKHEIEKVYGAAAINLLYGDTVTSRVIGAPLLYFLSRFPFFSAVFGWWQKSRFSRKKIKPFIAKFGIDVSEFLENVDSFPSFNDFFIRKLKPEARPIDAANNSAIIPADGRYYFYQDMSQVKGFVVKDQKFCIETLLQNKELASRYMRGSLVIARLCPTDYHRFHFPCECTPTESKLINGYLYSVNPQAIRKNIDIFSENKRTICELETKDFGKILFLEIGATSVGSINQTYQPHFPCAKGDEKGYFSFGASSLILMFEPGKIQIDEDLLRASQEEIEIKCLMGSRMGTRD